FNAHQDARFLAGKVDSLRALRKRYAFGAFQAEREFTGWVFGKGALVDFGLYFAPAVERLHGVIAPFDLGEFNQCAALIVDRDPRLAVYNVKVGISPIRAPRAPVACL